MATLGAGHLVQRLGGVVHHGVVRQGLAVGLAQLVQARHQPARRAARDGAGQRRAQTAGALQRGAVGSAGIALGAQHKRRAHLHAAGPQLQRSGNARAVHDAAGGHHRQARVAHQQLHQPQRAHALVVRGVEHATVAARLHALGHHHVDTGALDVQRLLQRGGAGQGQATGAAQCVDEMRLGQAKVKTHHRRALLQHHALQRAIAHRRGVNVVQALGGLRPKLGKFGCQILQPSGFARAVVLAVVVAKQIDVEGRLRQRPRALDLGLRSFHAQCAQAQRAQPPALAHGSGQFGGRGARHRGLNDGVAQSQLIHPWGNCGHIRTLLGRSLGYVC